MELCEVTRQNWRRTLDLSVTPEQQHFLAGHSPVALVGLAKAHVHDLGYDWTGLLFSREGDAVGFAMVAHDPANAVDQWIFHFFIDSRFQRKGLGYAALGETINHIRTTHPNCRRTYLTVHPENLPAQKLYEKAGFRRTDEERFGEPVYLLSLDPV
jgi:diamine N-acetyltransferase